MSILSEKKLHLTLTYPHKFGQYDRKSIYQKSINTDFERGIRKVALRKKMVDPSELLTGSMVKLFKDEITGNPLEIIFADPKK